MMTYDGGDESEHGGTSVNIDGDSLITRYGRQTTTNINMTMAKFLVRAPRVLTLVILRGGGVKD